jgi:hypothetical protein
MTVEATIRSPARIFGDFSSVAQSAKNPRKSAQAPAGLDCQIQGKTGQSIFRFARSSALICQIIGVDLPNHRR